MAILRKTEIRKMDEKEMDKRLTELQLEMAKERANISIGATVVSPGRIKEIRKTIARILTIKNQKKNSKSVSNPKKKGE